MGNVGNMALYGFLPHLTTQGEYPTSAQASSDICSTYEHPQNSVLHAVFEDHIVKAEVW